MRSLRHHRASHLGRLLRGGSLPLLTMVLLAGGVPAATSAAAGPTHRTGGAVVGTPDEDLEGGIEPLRLPPVPTAPAQPAAGDRTAASTAAGTLPSYTVVDLGRGATSNASDINEDGAVSGTIFDIAGEQPVVWQGERTTRLDTGGATRVRGMAIGDDGTVGGWQHDGPADQRYAVSWTPDGEEYDGVQRISLVTGSGGSLHGGEVQAVGTDGALQVTQPKEHVPFGSDLVWRAGEVTPLGGQAPQLPALATFDMNQQGQVTGLLSDGVRVAHAAVWTTSGDPEVLPDPLTDATTTRGLAINDDGDIVVESVRSTDEGTGLTAGENPGNARVVAIHRQDGYTDLGDLYGDGDQTTGDSNLIPWDVNNTDDVVGAAAVSLNGEATELAFLWRDGSAVDLNTVIPPNTGWVLNSAHAINERGQIVGIGTLGGVQSAFLLDPTRPLLFVPGAGASILKSFDDPAAPEEIWLGCGKDRMRLSRFPEDDPDQDVRAVDTTRYLDCYIFNGRFLDALNAYGGMLDQLTTRYGYREYRVDEQVERRTTEGCDLSQRAQSPNLFVFAYDWRQDNRISARELEDYVGCIQQFFPGVEIDVVTHSMGSLVARRYVMNNRGATGLHKVVTVGAPWLGAPRLVNVLNTGDFIDNGLANGGSEKVKHVVSGFPAAHQLMSGPYYHQLAGSVFSEEGWDYDGDGVEHEQYDWANLKEALDTRWSRTAPADTAESFQTQGGSDGQADWSGDPDGALWTHVYGIQAGQNTIGRIAAVRDTTCALDLVCVTHDYLEQRMTNGDGTVPTTSANRISGDDDLNAPSAKLVPVPVFDEDDNATVEHTALTRHPKTLQTMMAVFRGATRTSALAGDKPSGTPAPYRYVTLRGAGDVVLHDGQGNNDAPLDEETRIKLPGTQHLSQGADAEMVTMPADVEDSWTVTFTGLGRPMSLEAVEGTQEAPETVVRWRDLVIPAGHAAELLLTPTGLERLRVDTDGDGNLDTTVPATSDVTGEDARDTEPPTVSLSATTVDGERRYVVEATDGRSGSGVTAVYWSTDGERFSAYDAPVRAPLAATLFAFAEDHAGNRSAITELDLHAAAPAPVTRVQLDPTPAPSGWSPGSTTVTLTATAGVDSPVDSIRYRATGANPIEETVAPGERVELVLDRPGRTTLWFQAIAADGTTEDWRQRVLRIDAAPPTLRVRAPAAGGLVDSMTQIAGVAADDAAGVRQVEVLLERTGDGLFWDGDGWVAAPVWLPARGTATWRMTDVPGLEQFPNGAYAVRARATDGAGQVTTSAAVTFVKALAGRMSLTELEPADGKVAFTSAGDVNDSGRVVGVTGSVPALGTRWDNGVAAKLATPAGHKRVHTLAVAADGSAAGDAERTYDEYVAVRWALDGTPHVLPHLPGALISRAEGISSAGVVGVSGDQPVWWRDDHTAVALPTLQPGQTGVAYDIDSTGTVVGHVVDATDVPHAVVWTDDGREVTDLGTLGGEGAVAQGINDVGQVVGHARTTRGVTQPFVADVFEGEPMTEIYVPTENWAMANDIGDDGTIVGDYLLGDGETTAAFVVRDGRFQPLSLMIDPDSDWVPLRAKGVNNVGQVVGIGLLNGVGRGFIASSTHAPVATDVTADTDEGTPVTVQLPATDPDPGTTLSVEVVDGPAHGTLSAIDGHDVEYVPAAGYAGTDSFTFRASDGDLRSNLATVTVHVQPDAEPNQHPVAVVTAPASVPEGATVTLDGSGSSDADGEVTAYAWDLDGDGAYDDATGPTATLAVADEGLYPVALQVTDDDGATGIGSSSVEAVNVAPLVSLPPTARAEAGTELRLGGSFTDPGLDSWSATVDIGAGEQDLPLTQGGAFTVVASWAEPGTRQVRVTVCDGSDCGTATTSVEVHAKDPGQEMDDPPVATLEVKPAKPFITTKVTLNGAASTGSGLTYSWDFGDGGTAVDATGPRVRTVFREPGYRTVRLTVTDAQGRTDTDEERLLVRRAVSCNGREVASSGSWREVDSADAPKGDYCDNLGSGRGKDTLTYQFAGNLLDIYHGRLAGGGTAVVFIDGRRRGTIDFRSTDTRLRFRSHKVFTDLGGGRHTVRLVVRRGAAYLDSFISLR